MSYQYPVIAGVALLVGGISVWSFYRIYKDTPIESRRKLIKYYVGIVAVTITIFCLVAFTNLPAKIGLATKTEKPVTPLESFPK
jgi:amino acid transporter